MTNQTPKQHRRIPKDLNPNAVLRTFFVAIAFLIAVFYGCAALVGCQKESSFTAPKGVIESDHHLKPAGGYNLSKRDVTPELLMASKKANPGKGKGKPGTDTAGGGGDNPPPPTGNAVILLDFDGQYVTGTAWNAGGPIDARYSGMYPADIAATVARVQEDYSPFLVTVTTDESVYNTANPYKRVRVIITESWEWYGMAGGVAYLGSFSWGDNTPAWVFSSLLGYGTKNVADAISHEAGHTLGLRHQGKCDGTQYNADIAPDGKGYLMGYPYDKISGWQVGVTPYCAAQDDWAIIRATLNQ